MKEKIDYLVKAWQVVTMNETRDVIHNGAIAVNNGCLLYTSPSPRDGLLSRMPSSA